MLVVHIGTQKTGTSALQAYLSENSEALLRQDIRYMEAGRTGHYSNGQLAQCLQGGGDVSVWEDLRRELAASTSHTNIISAEGFWFADPAAVKAQLADVPEIKIVVYFRRQDKYLQSLWKQAVAGGRKHDFDLWLKNLPFRGDYFSTLEEWAAQFGLRSLVVRPYERDGTPNTAEDFCRIIGAPQLPEPKNVGRNPSPRRELLHFVRAINHLNAKVNRNQLLRALTSRNPSYVRACDMLSYEESLALMERYGESNSRLIEKYYQDETTPLFPPLTKTDPVPLWDFGSEEFFKLTVDVLEVVVQFAARRKIALEGDVQGKRRRAHAAINIPKSTDVAQVAPKKVGRGRRPERGAAETVNRGDPHPV